jgi:hypothetical protein
MKKVVYIVGRAHLSKRPRDNYFWTAWIKYKNLYKLGFLLYI